MPLTWDARNCDVDFDDESEGVVTQTIVFMSAAIGMGTITEKNWKEFYIRSEVVNMVKGPFMYKGGESYSLTPRDIYRRISLKTNVGFETKTRWRANFMKGLESDAQWKIKDYDGNLS